VRWVLLLLLQLTACASTTAPPTVSPKLHDVPSTILVIPTATATATVVTPTATASPTVPATPTATPLPPTATAAPTATATSVLTPTAQPPTPTPRLATSVPTVLPPTVTVTQPAPITPTATSQPAAPVGGGGRAAPQGRDCPPGYPIKGNQGKEWIYHTPNSRSYNLTIPEDCFATEQDALDAGYRPARD
jgi:hypothetical protein